MEDAVFWRTLEAMKPQVFGAMFDALSGAMRVFHTVKLEHTPRMADFIRWGCAVTEALGMNPKHFLDIYFGNIAGQHDEALEASPIGNVVISFMTDKTEWQGTPSELLTELAPIAEALHVHTHKGYPKNPRWVTRRLKEMRVNLQEKGIVCELHRGDDRVIRLRKEAKNDDGDDGDVGNVDW